MRIHEFDLEGYLFTFIPMKFTFSICLVFSFLFSFSQEKPKDLYKRLSQKDRSMIEGNNHKIYPKFSAGLSYGLNLISDDRSYLVEQAEYYSMEFRASYKALGYNIYDQLWKYPQWGIGYFNTKLYSEEYLGSPNAVYAFIDVPFKRHEEFKNWYWSYSIAGGMSFNFRPGNEQDNPLNTMIGSYNNVHIDLGVYTHTRLSDGFDAKMGISFVHFSNGASSLPNAGINLVGPKVVLQHRMVKERPLTRKVEIPEWDPKNVISVLQAFGTKQLESGGEDFLNTTTAIAYKRWYSYKGMWIIQADLFYDESNNSGLTGRTMVPEDKRDEASNYYSVGLFAGHEAVYNRWSFIAGWGYYVWREYEYTNSNYQRFGVRYRVFQGLSLGVGLKARTFAADYIEYSLAYNIF